MSIVCAARKNGEIAISADTLTKYGALIASSDNRVTSCKLLRVNDSVVGLVGWCAVSTALEHLMKADRELFRFGNRMEILDSLLKLHLRLKRDYFIETREDRDQPAESSQLLGLIINAGGLYEVCSYRSVAEYRNFWAVGSGRRFALGAMYATLRSAKSARAVAEAGVRAASEFDDGCGLPLRTRVVGIRQ